MTWQPNNVLTYVFRPVSRDLAIRNGSIRYEDFLREIEEGEGDHSRRSPSPRCRKTFDGFDTSARGRLQASLSRAIDRGIDYRREMELEEEGRSASAGGTGMKEGVVSRQR